MKIKLLDYTKYKMSCKHKKKLHTIDVLLSIFISVINQIDAQNFCFTISLFHASTCFEHTCSSSGGQNCITQPLVSSPSRARDGHLLV